MGEKITRKAAIDLAIKTHDRLEQKLKDEVEREAQVPAVWEDDEAEKYEEIVVQRGIRSGMSYQSCVDWIAAFQKSFQHFLDTGKLIPFHIPKEVVEFAKEQAAKKGKE